MILERIKSSLGKRNVKVFLVLLLCSFLAWFINKLSQTFTNDTQFELRYVNLPNDFMLIEEPQKTVNVRIRATGFQLLGFSFKRRKIPINLSNLSRKDSVYYVAPKVYRKQIENKLSKDMDVLRIDGDTIFFRLARMISKEIPVVPRITYTLENDFDWEAPVAVTPSTVKVTGPANEIDTITEAKTAFINLGKINADFKQKLVLIKDKALKSTIFSPMQVEVSGSVFRFSEQIFEVPITLVNFPKETKVRTFPEKIKVLCQGKIEVLKKISSEDFKVVADYNELTAEMGNTLPVHLQEYPQRVSNAHVLDKEMEFILRRE